MIQATQIRKGMLLKIDGVPHVVMSVNHITPGNWRAMIICKMRNLSTNTAKEIRYRSSDRLEEADIEQVEMEYIYSADGQYFFMNTQTFEQLGLGPDLIAEDAVYLKPNIRVNVEFFEGKPFGIILPKYVELKVIDTQVHIKDATAQSQSKPAKLEGGHICQVPPFVAVGDVLKINTETGEYIERV